MTPGSQMISAYCPNCRYIVYSVKKVRARRSFACTCGCTFDIEEKYCKENGDSQLEPSKDMVNKPSHYHKNGIDVIGYLEQHFPKTASATVSEGFFIGNVIKYVSRYKEKNGLEDLEKAKFYLNKLLELEQPKEG